MTPGERLSYRLKNFITPYEFEDRASYFINSVIDLAKKSPELLVETENKTIVDLDLNSKAISFHLRIGNKNKTSSLYYLDHQIDTESADLNKILTTIFGNNKAAIREFAKKLDVVAAQFRGIRQAYFDVTTHNLGITDPDYKYFAITVHKFT